MKSSQREFGSMSAQRGTAAAINVLRERASTSGAQVPQITESSTGVMINRARELVRRATTYWPPPEKPRRS
ncbi:MAG: hypothetical protein WA431_14440 [Candidatus Cybelea sp.]|jgi:hypothetical protein